MADFASFTNPFTPCFICDKHRRQFNLASGSTKSVKMIEEISFLLKMDFKVVVKANNNKLFLCQPCELKISKTVEFVLLLEAANQRQQQMYSAPIKRLLAARKSQIIPKTQIPEQPNSVEAVDMPSSLPFCEHSYSAVSNTPKTAEKSDFNLLADFNLLEKQLLGLDNTSDNNVITEILNTIKSTSDIICTPETFGKNKRGESHDMMPSEPLSKKQKIETTTSQQTRIPNSESNMNQDQMTECETVENTGSELKKHENSPLVECQVHVSDKKEAPLPDNADQSETNKQNEGNDDDMDQESSFVMHDQNGLNGTDEKIVSAESIATADKSKKQQGLKGAMLLETNPDSDLDVAPDSNVEATPDKNLEFASFQEETTDVNTCVICNTAFSSSYNYVQHLMHTHVSEEKKAGLSKILDYWRKQNEQDSKRLDRNNVNQKDLCRNESQSNEEIEPATPGTSAVDLPDKHDLSSHEPSHKDHIYSVSQRKRVHIGHGFRRSTLHNKNSGEKSYKCGICGRVFNHLATLALHKRLHTGEKPYNCDICGFPFRSKGGLNMHKKKHTGWQPFQGEKPYKCDICGRGYIDKTRLNRHKKTHSDEKPYKCDVCERAFREKGALIKHFRIHTDEKQYKCDECGYRCNETYDLIKHKRKHTGEKPYNCDVCGATFKEISSLTKHKKRHRDGDTPFKCDVCGEAFGFRTSLTKHKREHADKRSYTCDICGYVGTCPSNLARHKRNHFDEKPAKHKTKTTLQKPYECDLCGLSFRLSKALATHKRKHTGEKQYICDVCGYGCNRPSDLVQHSRIHTGEKPFKCDICGHAFRLLAECKKHKRKHTGEKPFLCHICGRSFRISSSLVIHKRTHTGEKPYNCDVCGEAFSRSSNLIRHKRKHEPGEKPYKCDICGYGCYCPSDLTKHQRIHTGDRPYKCDVCGHAFGCSSNLIQHKKKKHPEVSEEHEVTEEQYENVVYAYVDSEEIDPAIHSLIHTG